MVNRKIGETSLKKNSEKGSFVYISASENSKLERFKTSLKGNGIYITNISPISFYPSRDENGESPSNSFPSKFDNLKQESPEIKRASIEEESPPYQFEERKVSCDMKDAIKRMVSLHELMSDENLSSPIFGNDTNEKDQVCAGVSATIIEDVWNENKAFKDPNPQEAPHTEPVAVYATYNDDLNIFKIHEAIRARYSYKLSKVDEDIKSLIESVTQIKSNKLLTLVEKRTMLKEKEAELESINKVKSLEYWKKYISDVSDFLKDYAKITASFSKGTVIFGDNEEVREQEPDKSIVLKRQILIHQYLRIASSHIEIHAFPSNTSKSTCPVCGLNMEDAIFSDDHGTYICKCGRETIGTAKVATFRDSTRVDTGIKNSYEDLANFIKRIDAFEGKQRTQPPEILYEQLEDYFISNPLPCGKTSQEIRDSEYTPDGKKEGTSISLLAEALLNTLNSAFYRDSELIAHKFWGWKLADLSVGNIRKSIINDYIETQKIYEEIKERESSLNVNLRLFFHLRARGYPCEITDFKVVSSRESLEYHQKMMKEMCRRTGLEFTPIL